ncbi:hypothetical protein DM860_000252 [Cuscuta australis]|uniref:At1g61320/AtMIF1 LRR domain-containing protein n=1 Tax=Cuscuta australis TaxID=267555 RepID=A0A328CYN7_9ASTE|nr:hypothetical protein DM860_000252 [Cuscuta australis]
MAKPAVRRHAAARDRTSQLPVEILDHIMGLLPIQQAAKTAVLSKVWRDVWFSLTRLCFDHDFFSYFNKKYRRASKYVKKSSCLYVINKVLLQHKGCIRKFVFLYGNAGKLTIRSRSFDMDQWLLLVTRKGVEDIHLHFGHNEYKLPSFIFSCSTLRTLRLDGFSIQPQNSPCSLRNLSTLCFANVKFVSRYLANNALDVPKLENLVFKYCEDIFHFNITARKLCSLKVNCCSGKEVGKFLPVNLDLTSICTLDLDYYTLVYIIGQYTTKECLLQLPALNVELLKLSSFCFHDDARTSAFTCLLCKCPKLCNLEISFAYQWGEDINKCIDAESKRLKKLRRVLQTHKMLLILKLSSFSGLRPQMHFIQEMLACLPTLEKVIISRPYRFDRSKEHETFEEISHFPRASAKAKLVFPS